MLGLLPIGALLLALQAPVQDQVSPRAVVDSAMGARDAEPARQRWRRAARDSTRLDALLGLATLERLASRQRTADSLYALLERRAGAAGPYPLYAALGRADSRLARGLYREAADGYRRALELAGSDRRARVEALLGLAAAVVRTERDDISDSLFAIIDTLIPAGQPGLVARYRCARAGPPFLGDELPELEEARAGAALAHTAGDPRLEAQCLLGVAKAHYRLGARDSALELSSAAASLARTARDAAGLAVIQQWRGYLRLTSGDYGGAWHELNDALSRARETGSLAPAGVASLYLASLSLRFGDPGLALRHATLAESLLTASGNRRTLGTLRLIRGDIARAVGDTATARRIYTEVIARRGRFGGYAAVAPYRGLATLARLSGRWREADSLLDRAQALARTQGMQEWDQRLGYDRAAVALARGDDAAARRGLLAFLAGLGPAEQARGYAARVRLAELAARAGDLPGAERWLRDAADSLDAARARLDVPALRLQAFQIRDDEADPDLGFASVIARLAGSGRAAAAFALVERRRARELLEQLLRGGALSSEPQAGTLPPASGPPADLPLLLQARHAAILSYVTGQGGEPTTAFVLSGAGLVARTLPPVDSLAPLVARFTDLVESGAPADAPATELGHALLDPALEVLPDSIATLIIVPDAGLQRLPFPALRIAGGSLLLDRVATATVPGVRVLERLWRRSPREGPAAVAAFGDPRGAPRVSQPVQASLGDLGALTPLPAARAEARAVARYAAGSAVFLGAEASEGRFRAEAGRWRVFHFATHAVASDQALTRTALVLAPDSTEDGLMEPGELSRLPLDADLVVLSACQSAAGVVVKGEGIRGLAAPLLEAGARAVLGSAWRVRDRDALDFMRNVYDGLADGLSAGAALRRAALQARGRGVPATVWAGFQLVGDPLVEIPLTRPRIRWPGLVFPAVAALAAGAWWWFRRRAQRAGVKAAGLERRTVPSGSDALTHQR